MLISDKQFHFSLGVPFFTLLLVYLTSVISNRARFMFCTLRCERDLKDSDRRCEA